LCLPYLFEKKNQIRCRQIKKSLGRESKPVLTLAVITFIVEMNHVTMGVGKIFSGGAISGFFQTFFWGGAKVVKFLYFPLETKKITFFC